MYLLASIVELDIGFSNLKTLAYLLDNPVSSMPQKKANMNGLCRYSVRVSDVMKNLKLS